MNGLKSEQGFRNEESVGQQQGLAVQAAKDALKVADCSPEEIDLLVLATTTPDDQIPATSAMVQHLLGLKCGAMDLNAACSGFVHIR